MRSVNRRVALSLGAGALAAGGMAGCGADAGRTAYPGPVLEFGPGINLHHLLNWPDMDAPGQYSWPPFQGDARRASPHEMAALRAIGFETLRITADPAIYLVSDPARRTELRGHYLDILRTVLDAGFKSAILDLHPVRQNPGYDGASLFADGEPLNRYAQMVRELAGALATLPAGRVALELFNEPPVQSAADLSRWATFNARLHAAAREGSAWLPLVIAGARWSQTRRAIELDPQAYSGSNVIYTFHYYAPHVFTHQSVPSELGRYVSGLTWPPEPARREATWAATRARIDADRTLTPEARERAVVTLKRDFDRYFGISDADAFIRTDFEAVAQWAGAHAIPAERIFLGEFGVCREEPETSPESRLRWLSSVRANADRLGFPWAFWAYQGSSMALMRDGRMDPVVLEALGLQPRAAALL